MIRHTVARDNYLERSGIRNRATFLDRLSGTWHTATMVTEEDVRQIALDFPGAFERASYGGRPSWRTEPRMFAWIRDEPEALVVWVASVEDKEALVASEPDKFFTTSHYDGYPLVLVRLETVDVDEVYEMVADSWRLRAPRSLTKRQGRE